MGATPALPAAAMRLQVRCGGGRPLLAALVSSATAPQLTSALSTQRRAPMAVGPGVLRTAACFAAPAAGQCSIPGVLQLLATATAVCHRCMCCSASAASTLCVRDTAAAAPHQPPPPPPPPHAARRQHHQHHKHIHSPCTCHSPQPGKRGSDAGWGGLAIRVLPRPAWGDSPSVDASTPLPLAPYRRLLQANWFAGQDRCRAPGRSGGCYGC
jgi:hypothetical protein